jgi:hypothetical protein
VPSDSRRRTRFRSVWIHRVASQPRPFQAIAPLRHARGLSCFDRFDVVCKTNILLGQNPAALSNRDLWSAIIRAGSVRSQRLLSGRGSMA